MNISHRRPAIISSLVGGGKLSGPDPTTSERHLLLSMLISNFLQAALLTTVSTSIINALAQGLPVSLSGSSEALVITEPEYLVTTLGRLAALGVPRGPLIGIHNFYTRSNFAARLTRKHFAGLDGAIGADDRALPSAQQVWMSACGAALLAMHCLPECNDFPIADEESTIQLICNAISQIGKGRTPFVRADGVVYVPGWFDVRRSIRRKLECASSLRYEGKDIPVTLLDLSNTGVGFRCPLGLKEHAVVRLLLPDGRSCEAQIIWRHLDRYGAVLAAPLAEEDPLLR
jgi:hypothetical protein